jgi:hypothetical protein
MFESFFLAERDETLVVELWDRAVYSAASWYLVPTTLGP